MSNNNTTITDLKELSELLDLVAEDRAESACVATDFKDLMGGKMHILLDILLTNSFDLAVVKVALATDAKYPDLRIDSDIVARFSNQKWEKSRLRARWFARKIAGDADGLEIAWMMIAADPKSASWSYAFVTRMAETVFLLTGEPGIQSPIYGDALRRMERWEAIRDGFPALGTDPFYAVTDAGWRTSELERAKDQERRRERLAAEYVKKVGGLKPVVVTEDDAQDDAEEDFAGVKVISGSPKLSEPYKSLIGSRTLLHPALNIVSVRNALLAEFPHAGSAIDTMLVDLREDEPLRFRPFLLVGAPGSGKSRLIRRLAELLSAPIRRYDAAASADNAFGGTPKRWSTALACFPLTAIAETKVANPVVMIDELDKAAPGYWNGSLHTAMMPFLERETSKAYPDVGFEIEVDLSHVNYCATANDDSHLPKPLKDRLRVIKVPSPGIAQLPLLATSIMKDLAVELNVPASFLPPLAPDELAVIARAWGTNGSVRKLQKIVRGTVTARDASASRH
jgi:hypothetical protein